MRSTSERFIASAGVALHDPRLQPALQKLTTVMPAQRARAIATTPEFDALCDYAARMKDHVLDHLDDYLAQFGHAVTARGGHVHHAVDAAALNRIVVELCREHGARRVIKGKSMVGEETALNDALEAAGLEVAETDLGEYIIQQAGEPPSHIIGPALHKSRQQVADLFQAKHALGPRALDDVESIVREARAVLRERFLAADVGITGANALVAETGAVMLVTNEGNGDLCSTLPPLHIVIASIEKLVPTPEDASALHRVLCRSATGQVSSAYTTFYSGPRRAGEADGPAAFHVILLDNGRRDMLGGKYRSMLRCIRCAACLNHCPVYRHVGGHAYGWVYPGPMGSVLTPLLDGLDRGRDLPHACTGCGRCEQVCPMRIPLPEHLRQLRADIRARGLAPRGWRAGIGLMRTVLGQPLAYRWATRLAQPALAWLERHPRVVARIPLLAGWAQGRRLPQAAPRTFLDQWQSRGDAP